MFKKLFYKEDGFTLVELLVTIAILAVLFGITTLTLGGVGANAQTTVCAAEVAVVQSAIDIYLAADGAITLSSTPATISPSDGEFAKYLRSETLGLYSWTAAGVLTAGTCPAPAP